MLAKPRTTSPAAMWAPTHLEGNGSNSSNCSKTPLEEKSLGLERHIHIPGVGGGAESARGTVPTSMKGGGERNGLGRRGSRQEKKRHTSFWRSDSTELGPTTPVRLGRA